MCKIYSVIQLSSSFRRLFNKDNTDSATNIRIFPVFPIPVFMGLGMYGEKYIQYNKIQYITVYLNFRRIQFDRKQ